MIRVLIADDHPVVCRGLKQLLTEDADIAEPTLAGNGQEVLRWLRCGDWDVLVLDLNMPGLSGLALLHEVKQLRPRLPVLVLSVHPEEQLGVRVLRAGAAGYLTKDCAGDELVRAIRRVAAGGRFISAALAELLAEA